MLQTLKTCWLCKEPLFKSGMHTVHIDMWMVRIVRLCRWGGVQQYRGAHTHTHSIEEKKYMNKNECEWERGNKFAGYVHSRTKSNKVEFICPLVLSMCYSPFNLSLFSQPCVFQRVPKRETASCASEVRHITIHGEHIKTTWTHKKPKKKPKHIANRAKNREWKYIIKELAHSISK